jgi:hypothetical protein
MQAHLETVAPGDPPAGPRMKPRRIVFVVRQQGPQSLDAGRDTPSTKMATFAGTNSPHNAGPRRNGGWKTSLPWRRAIKTRTLKL